jgi:hypothetical protein
VGPFRGLRFSKQFLLLDIVIEHNVSIPILKESVSKRALEAFWKRGDWNATNRALRDPYEMELVEALEKRDETQQKPPDKELLTKRSTRQPTL